MSMAKGGVDGRETTRRRFGRRASPPEAGIAGLIERALTGDMGAFEKLVHAHYEKVYAYARRMVGADAADDVTQEVFLRVYRFLDGFRGDAAFGTWVQRIAHNVCIDCLRRRKGGPSVPLDKAELTGEASMPATDGRRRTADPEAAAEARELEDALYDALGALSDKHRAVVVLHDLHGYRYEEVAAIVGCSLGTVKSRLHYARRALRKRLKPWLAPPAADKDAGTQTA